MIQFRDNPEAVVRVSAWENGGMAMSSPLPVLNGVGATRLHLPLQGDETIAEHMVARFTHLDATRLYARFDRGEIIGHDGTVVHRDARLGSHEFVWYYREPPVEREVPFYEDIVHVDDDLVVIDKPHFLPTTPGGQYVQNSALVRLRNRLGNPDLTPIHRLDRATAGLLMFSARPSSRGPYQLMFERRAVQKTYEAVSARPHDFDASRFPLVHRNHIEKVRQCVTVLTDSAREPNSETRIDVIAEGVSGGTDAGLPVVHFRLHPHTGRMHQLRVHLAELNMGILNDGFYPVLHPEAPDDHARPLQLLARNLTFVDPLTGLPRTFTSARTLQEIPRAD